LLDDFGSGSEQLGPELAGLLRGAEERVKQEFATAPRNDPVGKDAPVVLSPELAWALGRPVGDYGSSASVELSTRPLEHVAWGPSTDVVREDLTDTKGATVVHSPPPAAPSASSVDTDFEARNDPAAPPPRELARTRPPKTSAAAATQRALTPLPKAPPLPSDVWVDAAVNRGGPELTQLDRLERESFSPGTSRSAQPNVHYDSERNTAERFTAGGVEALTGHGRLDDGISTIPPSALPSSHGGTQSPDSADAREDDPTTRPPRRRDTASPSGTDNRPPSERSASEQGVVSDSGRNAPPETALVELREGTAISTLASAICRRFSGAIAFESDQGIRRAVLRDGDLVTVASGIAQESLLHYLVSAGHLAAEVSAQLGHRVPSFGRHAGAALIASGYLPQDQLWPTLRAHAEFILSRALAQTEGVAALEVSVPERLRAEPSVFGGATGSEVLVEVCRRVVDVESAIRRLGGEHVRLVAGAHYRLLDECALSDAERAALPRLASLDLGDALGDAPNEEFACVLYALRELSVLKTVRSAAPRSQHVRKGVDPLDDEAIRKAVLARRALVEDGDYFMLLGVPRSATGYHVRQAYLDLRRSFDPGTVLRPATLDLTMDVELINEVISEAYEVLRDPTRRERYRRAIEAVPPCRPAGRD
jgi:hypothetical protein